MKYLSDNLNYLLRINGINATNLAKLISVSQPTLNRIKKGETKEPQLESLTAIADYFGVTVHQLINIPLDDKQKIETSYKTLREPTPYQATTSEKIKTMPLLEIEQAIEYIEKPNSTKIGNCEKIATTTKHSPLAFAVKMFDNSMRSTDEIEESFNKNDILIAEPQIKPKHEDIVVVNLNPQKKIGMVAKLEIDPFGTPRLRRTGMNIAGENPMEMPEGSYICGVVIEIRRRRLSQNEVETRLNKTYDPLSSMIEKSDN